MATTTPDSRESFLRERSERTLAISRRLFDPRLLYGGYLLTGAGTLVLCVARSPLTVAITFVAYLAGLVAFVLLDRRRFVSAVAELEAAYSEQGPPPDPEATRSLPRYLLTALDAVNVPMLDVILVLTGDSLTEFKGLAKQVFGRAIAYRTAPVWTFAGGVLTIIAIVGFPFGHKTFQFDVGELTLIGLALVPPVIASRDAFRYALVSQGVNLRRVREAETVFRTMTLPDPPFIDGNAVKYRDGSYVIDKREFRPPVDDASVERRRKRQRSSGIEIFLGIAVAVSVLAFCLHPMSGILVP